MLSFFRSLFDSTSFMPHGMCYLWNPALIRLHALSDLAIGLSYVVIAFTLASFVRRARSDVPFSWIFIGFGVFILACGGTHLMEVWTLWTPTYWLSGALKLFTAVASISVAIALPPLLPKSLALIRAAKASDRLSQELERANRGLQTQMADRNTAEEEVRRLNAHLEELVRARTAELSEAHQSLTQMVSAIRESNDANWTLNLEGRITGWNPAAERLYGYRAEEVLGQPATMLTPAARTAEPADLIARASRGKIPASFETVRVRKSGEPFYVFLTVSAIRNLAGEFLGVSITATDITVRRRAEEMFRIAVEAAPSGMLMVDAAGNIALANAHTEKLFGYSREELLGGTINMLVPQRYRAQHPSHRQGFMGQPSARMGAGRALYALRKDGTEVPVEIGLNPIETDQGMLVLCAIVDITQRKQADEEIQRLQQSLERRVADRTAELIASNAELEAFSYSVAHDLRAPLRQISGFSKILAEEHGEELDEEARRYLRRVQDGAQYMGSLIDDLLNLAQIGRQALSRHATPLNDVINAALEKMEPESAGRKIEWRIGELGCAECDPVLIQQVFVNLLSNAVKFTRYRDRAVIEVGRIAKDGERIFFVRDNGAGFDMAYAGKLFGVFQRLHKRQDFEGTGVGLANAQKIVKKHRGRIWAESEIDQGTTFFFTIPDEPAADEPAAGVSAGQESAAG